MVKKQGDLDIYFGAPTFFLPSFIIEVPYVLSYIHLYSFGCSMNEDEEEVEYVMGLLTMRYMVRS